MTETSYIDGDIRELPGLTTYSRNVLWDAGVFTVQQLMAVTEFHLRGLPGCGNTTLRNVTRALAAKGLKLAGGYPGNRAPGHARARRDVSGVMTAANQLIYKWDQQNYSMAGLDAEVLALSAALAELHRATK